MDTETALTIAKIISIYFQTVNMSIENSEQFQCKSDTGKLKTLFHQENGYKKSVLAKLWNF